MRFGTFYAYWEREWRGDYMAHARRIRNLGFEVMEVPAAQLLEIGDAQIRELRALCADIGLEISSNIGPEKRYDVASADPQVRQNGIEYHKAIMQKMVSLDSRVYIGVIYSYWPCDFGSADKKAAWAYSVESVKELGKYARDLGIDLCMEVVNRFEHFLLNTGEEAVAFCRDVDLDNVLILLDTFHMNIEEDNLPDAIRGAGARLGHLHVGEGNRKVPGKGHLPWTEIGRALRDIGYDRYVVMEPFVLSGGQVGRDIKVWRDLSGGADAQKLDDDIRESLRFLRTTFLK